MTIGEEGALLLKTFQELCDLVSLSEMGSLSLSFSGSLYSFQLSAEQLCVFRNSSPPEVVFHVNSQTAFLSPHLNSADLKIIHAKIYSLVGQMQRRVAEIKYVNQLKQQALFAPKSPQLEREYPPIHHHQQLRTQGAK